MKRFPDLSSSVVSARHFLTAVALCSVFLLTMVTRRQLEMYATQMPSTNLAINFTNKGEGSAYVHWMLPPGLTTQPNTANFGVVAVGAQSLMSLTLTNDGPVQIELLPLEITGTNASDFTFLSQCNEYLDPTVSCKVNVTFKPSAVGARSATLTIPFAGMGQTPPASLQIILTKVEPPSGLVGVVVPRT